MFKLIRQFSSIQSSVRTLFPSENRQVIRCYSERVATAIRKKKSKSTNVEVSFRRRSDFIDFKCFSCILGSIFRRFKARS